MLSPQHALRVLDNGRWEGTIRTFCEIMEMSCNDCLICDVVGLQLMPGNVSHRLLQIQFQVRQFEVIASEDVYLRLDWPADSSRCSNESKVPARRGSNLIDFVKAMLATSECCLLQDTTSTVEATYLPNHRTLTLSSLGTFFRVCCEELDPYSMMADTCSLFYCLVMEYVTGEYPDSIDIDELKSISNRIRRRVRIRHHIESGNTLELLTYADQLEFLFSTTTGRSVIGTMESAQQLINLHNMISKTRPTEQTSIVKFVPDKHLVPLKQDASTPKLFARMRTNQPLLTVTLSETLRNVLQSDKKITIFRDVSKRFLDEATLRGLISLRGSNATADFADLGWKLVKYRLYLPAPDAALLMRGVERLARQLVEKEPTIYHKGLLHETLTAYGEELGGPCASVTKEPRMRKRDVFGDAVTVARLLNETQPGAHLDSLADSLGSYCLALVELGEYEKASEACRESIEMWRILYKQRFAELKEMGCEGGMQQVFRDWCWCYCTDDEPCEAVTELLLIADSFLNDPAPVEVTAWPTMFSKYGAFLTAAAAAPEDCKTVRMGRPQS